MTNGELKELAKKVLADAHSMSLGTVDEGGVWVSEVVFISDEGFNVYWSSMPSARHSKAIEKNSAVACAITASFETKKERALQMAGTVEKVEGTLLEYEKKLQEKRGSGILETVGGILYGRAWYKLTPTKVELVHNELFGYKKQHINLD